MRIRLAHNGTVFEFERRPLPERRFRALCLLAAAGIYAGMMVSIATLCGLPGVAAMIVLTLFALMIAAL